jgi:antitoxin CcdA
MKRASGRKVATNLSVRQDLVRHARAMKLNLSEVLEHALERAIRDAERASWLAENEESIEEYNRRVEKRGVFSDSWRRF